MRGAFEWGKVLEVSKRLEVPNFFHCFCVMLRNHFYSFGFSRELNIFFAMFLCFPLFPPHSLCLQAMLLAINRSTFGYEIYLLCFPLGSIIHSIEIDFVCAKINYSTVNFGISIAIWNWMPSNMPNGIVCIGMQIKTIKLINQLKASISYRHDSFVIGKHHLPFGAAGCFNSSTDKCHKPTTTTGHYTLTHRAITRHPLWFGFDEIKLIQFQLRLCNVYSTVFNSFDATSLRSTTADHFVHRFDWILTSWAHPFEWIYHSYSQWQTYNERLRKVYLIHSKFL